MLDRLRHLLTPAANLYAQSAKASLEEQFGEVVVFQPKGRHHFEAFFRHPVYQTTQTGAASFEGKQVIACGKNEGAALLGLFNQCALPSEGQQIWAYREPLRERESLYLYDVIGFGNGRFTKIDEKTAIKAPSCLAGITEQFEIIPTFLLRSID